MNDKNLLNLPEYPCTRCEHKTDRCISEPKHCTAWTAWDKALTEVGVAAAQAIYATSDRDALHDYEERAYEAYLHDCPCCACPNQVCEGEPDGRGSCFAYCAWKVGADKTQRRVDPCLLLTLQLLRARAGEYYQTWRAALPGDSHDGPLDTYTAYYIYDAAASIIAEALDGNYEVLQQFVGASELPDLPSHDYVDWNTNIRLDQLSE